MIKKMIICMSFTIICFLFMDVRALASETNVLRTRQIVENEVFQKTMADRITQYIKMGASSYPPEDHVAYTDFMFMPMKIWKSTQDAEIFADMCLKYSIWRSGKLWTEENIFFCAALVPYLNGQAFDKIADSDLYIKSTPAYTGTQNFVDFLTPITDLEQKTKIGDRKISGAVSLGTFHFSGWVNADDSLEPDPVYTTVYDGKSYKVTYSDGTVAHYDSSYRPLFINGTLMKTDAKNALVPLRLVAEALGGQVCWEASLRAITLSIDTARARENVQMTIGSNVMYISSMGWGTREQENTFAPGIINGQTYVPIYFLSECFSLPLTWEPSLKLMSWPPANIYVEGIDDNENAIDSDDALQLMKETQNANFDLFQKECGTSGNAGQETTYAQIRQNISETELTGEIPRYYIFNSCGGTFFMDKVTGALFYQDSEVILITSVEKFEPGDFKPFMHYFS